MNTKMARGLSKAVSTSTVAMAAVLPVQAIAQDGLAGLKVTADGGASFSNFTEEFWTDGGAKLGSIEGDIGYFGSVSVSKSINDAWDWRLTATHLSFPENDNFFSSGGTGLTLGGGFSSTGIDFDIGKKMSYGSSDVRFGLGVTGGQMNETIKKGIIGSGGFVDSDLDTRFLGFGAKVSADLSRPFNETSPYRLIAGGSLGAMQGKYTLDKGISGSSGGTPFAFDIGDSENGLMLTQSLYLGMAYDFSDSGSMRFGVRADRFDADDVNYLGSSSSTSGLLESPVLSTTAFVGVDIQF